MKMLDAFIRREFQAVGDNAANPRLPNLARLNYDLPGEVPGPISMNRLYNSSSRST